MRPAAPLPRRLEGDAAQAAFDDLVTTLRALIRIPSINPPDPARPDAELEAARWIEIGRAHV